MKLISVNDLSLQNEGYFAFKHVAFSLSQNEIIGINGDNGSGKTQFLEALANNDVADSGVIEYTPGVRVGYMPQENPQVINQTVGKYLEDVRRVSKDLAVRPEQLQGMVKFLGMSPQIDRPVRQLSLGLRRRVDFLAAVVGHPNVLLLDEPFAFQSNEVVKNMLSLLQDLKENGSGIVLVGTHFDESVNQYLDASYLFKENRLTKIASTTNQEKFCRLVFSVHPNSIAVTSDIERYITANAHNSVELQLPKTLRKNIVEKMTRLNYRLEEATEIEA